MQENIILLSMGQLRERSRLEGGGFGLEGDSLRQDKLRSQAGLELDLDLGWKQLVVVRLMMRKKLVPST